MASAATLNRSDVIENDLSRRHVLEYEKILRLRDEIFTGTHPRLKLMSFGSRRAGTSDHHLIPDSSSQPSHGVQDRSDNASQATPNSRASFAKSPSMLLPTNLSHATRSSPLAGSGTALLDPVLVTEPGEIAREETRQERQQIEGTLEEQVQQKRIGSRQRMLEQEALPDFDVSEVFFQAQRLVKPDSATEKLARQAGSSQASSDDRTYYSSQLNGSTSDELDEGNKKNNPRPCRYFFEGSCRKGASCTFSHDPAFRRQLEHTGALEASSDNRKSKPSPRSSRPILDAPMADARRWGPPMDEGVPDKEKHQPRPHHNNESPLPRSNGFIRGKQRDPRTEDSAHKPTGPQAPHDQPITHTVDGRHSQPNAKSPARDSPRAITTSNYRQVSPLAKDGRIVRNHITSPLAPQPARVSPLAVTKLPRLDQDRREPDVYGETIGQQAKSSEQSPVVQLSNPRKRRHEVESSDRARNVIQRRVAKSPIPYIKEEPISPPLFASTAMQEYPRYEGEGRRPMILGSPSALGRDGGFYQPVQGSYVDRGDLRRFPSPTFRRVISRAGREYEIRDEPEVRRVVSAQHPKRIPSEIQEPFTYSESRTYPRAVSYAFPPASDRSSDYQTVPARTPFAQSAIPLSPEVQQIQYAPVDRGSSLMAPPPRRIVFDQSGNEYFESTPSNQSRNRSVAYIDDRATAFRPEYGGQYRFPSTSHALATAEPVSPKYIEESSTARPLRAASRSMFYKPKEEIYRTVSGTRGSEPGRQVSTQPERSLPRDEAMVRRIATPELSSPRYVEYQGKPTLVRAVSRAPVYESHEDGYRSSRMPTYVDYIQPRLEGRPEEYVRRSDSVLRMQSVRPVAVPYEAGRPVSRIQTIQPEQRTSEMRIRVPSYNQPDEPQPEDRYGRTFGGLVDVRREHEYISRSSRM